MMVHYRVGKYSAVRDYLNRLGAVEKAPASEGGRYEVR